VNLKAKPGWGLPQAPSILSRGSSEFSPSTLSATQSQVDQLVTDFSKHASDWKTFAALTAGGLAYRAGRFGVMGTSSSVVRGPLSVVVGLGSEVSAFEFTNRTLHSFTPNSQLRTPNPWSFSGPGGLKEGWISSFVAFGALKGLGKLGEGQNLILQHGAQDAGMVLSHQLVYAAGLGPRPEGTLAERFLHAEATNLQMRAGMALGQGLLPGLTAAPLSADRVTWNQILGRKNSNGFFPASLVPDKLATAGVEPSRPALTPVMMMSEMGSGGPGGKGPVGPPRTGGGSKPPPIPKDPLIGQIVDGRYKVEDVIGSGGMGIVYRCTHVKLGSQVAIKVLRTHQATNPESIERFKNEAIAASTIGNSHIIGIKDIGLLPNGSTYFVMEYLEGVPLSQLMEGDKPVPVTRLVPIARQIAVGLGAAHAKNIVHRDLKPGNIHLIHPGTEKEFVKILDFGIAKVLNSDRRDLTLTGDILGTPRYLSPEQARGEPVDHRSDIYSYGVLLYKMTTGRVPFESENLLGLLEAHKVKAPRPLRELVPSLEVPSLLETIIFRCLSKNPADRYQSMGELIADLDKLTPDKSSRALAVVRAAPAPILQTGTEAKTRMIRPQAAPSPAPEKEVPPAKSRWPLYVLLTGLGGGSLIAALFATGKLNFPSNSSPTPPVPPPTPPDPLPTPVLTPDAGQAKTPSGSDAGVPDASSPDAAVPDAAVPDATPPPPSPKQVELSVTPGDAHVFQGDKELQKPFLIDVERGKTVELEIRRTGYKTKKVILDDSQGKISVQLEKEPKKPTPPQPPPPDPEDPKPPYKDFE